VSSQSLRKGTMEDFWRKSGLSDLRDSVQKHPIPSQEQPTTHSCMTRTNAETCTYVYHEGTRELYTAFYCDIRQICDQKLSANYRRPPRNALQQNWLAFSTGLCITILLRYDRQNAPTILVRFASSPFAVPPKAQEVVTGLPEPAVLTLLP
jgi:hypothetical protein